jgi:hypothetical protein
LTGEVYSIQHYRIKLVSDFRQVRDYYEGGLCTKNDDNVEAGHEVELDCSVSGSPEVNFVLWKKIPLGGSVELTQDINTATSNGYYTVKQTSEIHASNKTVSYIIEQYKNKQLFLIE